MGQYLKGNDMAQIKIHNGGYYAHAQTSNAQSYWAFIGDRRVF